MDKRKRNQAVILAAINKMNAPANSTSLTRFLTGAGCNLSERTVRLYLQQLDAEGFTVAHGKRRVITERGIAELRAVDVVRRVGCLAAKIDKMAYSMTFDSVTRTGLVVVNISIVDPHHLAACKDDVCKVFAQGYAMGSLLALIPPGESLGDWSVPVRKLGLCTVCSITLNGLLMKHGVPTTSRFGGLLELCDGRPTRFVEMIHYEGTSIDPLEVFIRSGMTDFCGAIRDGNGLICAGFREIPENSRDLAMQLAERASTIGLGSFMEIGWPDQPVLEIPVTPGRIGVVISGGLNPVSVLEERGYRVNSRAIAGLLEYSQLFHFGELSERLKPYL